MAREWENEGKAGWGNQNAWRSKKKEGEREGVMEKWEEDGLRIVFEGFWGGENWEGNGKMRSAGSKKYKMYEVKKLGVWITSLPLLIYNNLFGLA